MTLYKITGDYLRLMEMAEDDDVDMQAFNDTLEAINADLEDKADAYAKMIRTLEGDEASIQSEIDRLNVKKVRIHSHIDALKQALEKSMRATGKLKFKTKLFSFGIQKNPASVRVDDTKAIPEKFWKHPEPVLDKAALRDALKNGEVPGAHLEQGESLRIK